MQKTFFIGTEDLEVKGVSDNKTLKIAGYANTSDKDRSGDIVLAEAWAKGVDNFRRNPILLYQHDHAKPIGKVNNITVDKKGIFVEASVSDAAETQHGVKTLIKDGVLKSFSVGFRVKDADYDKRSDSFIIKDVELLEISVVSVPANQNSLFSIRKSFESDTSYADFKKQFIRVEHESSTEEVETEQKAAATEDLDNTVIEDPMKQIPFISLLGEDTSGIMEKSIVVINGSRYISTKTATVDSPYFIFDKYDASGIISGEQKKINPVDITILNSWDLGTGYDLQIVVNEPTAVDEIAKASIYSTYKSLVNNDELTLIKLKSFDSVVSDRKMQRILNDSLNLSSTAVTEWTDSHYVLAKKHCAVIDALKKLPAEDNRNLMLNVYGHNIHQTLEEKKNMTTENVGEPITVNNKAAASTVDTKAATATVAEPRVAQLVEKAGQAVLAAEAAEYKAAETGRAVDSRVMEELAELRGQVKAYREQVVSAQTSKMLYQENTRSASQFSEKDMSNAVFLAKALNKHVFNTRMGDRMKAVLTDTNLQEAFSTNVYHEMQQQLVVAPMFSRIEVNSKDFRIPVADEDTSDFVAQFPSGSFAAGVTDWTTVPTSRQAQIGAVDLQPKKFMVSTHIAKDEEEDTILPLLDFLRQAATRRMARGIDKALLRGDGSLSAFSTSNALSGAGTYPSVIKGIVELAAGVNGLVSKTGTTTGKAGPGDIAAARLALGKYGLALGTNLAYITSVEGYNNLVTNTDFQTVDKFGAQATYLTGSVGAVYGIPIYISEFMDTASAADSNLGVLVYKPGFIIGERRAMEIESEYLPQQQVTAMYLSTRFDFKALTTVSNAALSTRYSYASLITTASS